MRFFLSLIECADILRWSAGVIDFCQMRTDRRTWSRLIAMLLVFAVSQPGWGNVCATNIKFNGSTNNAATVPAAPVLISYILNEPATNVIVAVLSGATVIWSNSLAGTNTGSNSVVWGGTNQAGDNVAAGIYQVSITAAAAGHPAWTNITDDSANFAVLDPVGIAVNKNTNSPFYGRVFVGCDTPDYAGTAGIYKCNADGSPAAEGGFSQSYPWRNNAGYFYSPWKIAVAEDDTVYINDWRDSGPVLAFDETLSTNYITALDSGNYPYGLLSGPWVTGGGSETQIWMANYDSDSVGVVRWDVTNKVVAATDPGTVVVGISPSGVNLSPWDVSVDAAGNLYVIQCLDGYSEPAYYSMPRVLCFPPFTGQTELTPTWSIGSPDYSLESAVGIAVDPTGTLVAVAVSGYDGGAHNIFELTNGAVNIYYATNGALVTRLANGVNDEFWGVAWDQVGNLYTTDLTAAVWRVYSPPGANLASTVAVPIIQVYDALTQPCLGAPAAPADPSGQFGFTLTGQANVAYLIQCSPDLLNWSPIATNYDTVDVRAISLPMTGDTGFIRAIIP
jgi:hypothetical protein